MGIKWLNNDQWLLVTTSWKADVDSYKGNKKFTKSQTQPIVGLGNLLLINTEYVMPKNDETIKSKTIKYEIELYSIEHSSLKKEKVIDLNKSMKEYNSDYSVREATEFTSDEKYIIVYNWDIDKDEPFYFRLSDEKFFSQSELDPETLQQVENDKERQKNDNEKYGAIRSTNFQSRDIGTFYWTLDLSNDLWKKQLLSERLEDSPLLPVIFKQELDGSSTSKMLKERGQWK